MRSLSRVVIWVALVEELTACASSQYPDIDEPLPPGAQATEEVAPPSAATRPAVVQGGALQRADVERVIDAGLGRFLAQVAIEPSLSGGRFTGWSIVTLEPGDFWRSIDLKPGDVVTRVNGMPIERDFEAYDAFQAVRQAAMLDVSYIRVGQPRSLHYAIIGPPSLPPAPTPPAPNTRPIPTRPIPG